MRLSVLTVFAALLALPAVTLADPVTYTLTGDISGELGAFRFTDASATFTFVGDTSGIVDQGAGFYTDTDGISTITVDGLGTAVFLSSTFGAESEFNTAGFYDVASGFGVSIDDVLLGNYALTSPFSDTAPLFESFPAAFQATASTSQGDLSITSIDSLNGTFQASSPMTATPEPSSFLLLGTGLLSMVKIGKRRWVLMGNRW